MSRKQGFAVLLILMTACERGAAPSADEWGGYSVVGPWTHENLSVFLIEKKGAPGGDPNLLTLEEAFEASVLRVTESEGGARVGELTVENRGEIPVFIQAGDTLKGGQQDRTIAKDTLVPARSGKVALSAFCVEPGRWSQRASSSADFRANDVPVATKEQRLAVQLEQDQSRVWEAGKSAIQALAPGNDSYVLASEDRKLRENMRAYLEMLQPLIKGRDEVVGMAYAINGKVYSAEVYGSTSLLRKFWDKLARRSALEALAKKDPAISGNAVAAAGDVERFLRQTLGSPETREACATGLERSVRRTSEAVRFDARCGGNRVYSRLD